MIPCMSDWRLGASSFTVETKIKFNTFKRFGGHFETLGDFVQTWVPWAIKTTPTMVIKILNFIHFQLQS